MSQPTVFVWQDVCLRVPRRLRWREQSVPSPTGISPPNSKHHGRIVYIQTGNTENSKECSTIQSASSVAVHSLQSFSFYLISDQDKNRRNKPSILGSSSTLQLVQQHPGFRPLNTSTLATETVSTVKWSQLTTTLPDSMLSQGHFPHRISWEELLTQQLWPDQHISLFICDKVTERLPKK